MISLIGFIGLMCAPMVVWNHLDRGREEPIPSPGVAVICRACVNSERPCCAWYSNGSCFRRWVEYRKELKKMFDSECHAHKKRNIYCEDCMKIAQNVAKQNENTKCCLHGREKVYCGGCLTVLQQHSITVDKENLDHLDVWGEDVHLCKECSLHHNRRYVETLSGGICECCKSKRIHWVRQETDANGWP